MSQANTITMYSSSLCPFCRRALALFRHKGVTDIEIIDVDFKPKQRQEMIQLTGKTSVPQIWIGETYVGGCDDLYALEQQQQLDTLLTSIAKS